MTNHHRRSIRLPGYDYAQPGVYFVTLCVQQRACLFGEIAQDTMQLNPCGEIVQSCWQAISQHFPFAELDVFVIMPNHFHAIVRIVQGRGEALPRTFARAESGGNASPLPPPHGTTPGSLGAIVQNFKSVTTRRINALRNTPGQAIWQRNYYEHIVRNERDLNAIRTYIANNPMQWALDREHP